MAVRFTLQYRHAQTTRPIHLINHTTRRQQSIVKPVQAAVATGARAAADREVEGLNGLGGCGNYLAVASKLAVKMCFEILLW